jgi:pyridoxine 5-phosphate synthase
MVEIATAVRPDQVTLVPERPRELTTEGGLDVAASRAAVRTAVKRLHAAGIRVSVFIDPLPAQVRASKAAGVDAVEINTGAYASAAPADRPVQLERVAATARLAARQRLEVLAGHGLTYFNVRPIAAIPDIAELNIGHSIVARASLVGLDQAVREMVALLV